MKLKKIASLMLAGIMAVSMLAACGEGKGNSSSSSSSSQPTTSTGYTASVLNKTALAKTFVTGTDDAKLDALVKVLAENKVTWSNNSIQPVSDTGFITVAKDMMSGAEHATSNDLLSETALTAPTEANDGTYYALYYISKSNDVKEDLAIADKIDAIVKGIIDSTDPNVEDCKYTVSVAKADLAVSEAASGAQKDGAVIFGVVVTTDYTAPQY